MPWEAGVNQQHLWTRMNAPEWTGTCRKFQQGRLLMQRYQFTANYFELHDLYADHSKTAKEKSVVLAGRMIDHAKTCAICIAEERFDEEHFYGVYKRDAR